VRQRTRQPLAGAVRRGRRAGGADQFGAPGTGAPDRACARHAGGDRRHSDGRQPDEAFWRAAAPGNGAATPGPAQRRDRPVLWFRAAGAARGGSDPVIGRLAPPWDGLLLDARLATLRDDLGAYGAIDDGALAWKEGLIAWAGPRAELPGEPEALARRVESAQRRWITPGLVDCHTHLVFAGDRAVEFERRLQGVSYEQIAREGGGILSTVRATRAAGEAGLLAASLPRARALLADGVTTVEIKSGYGLDLGSERAMLRVARRIGEELGVDVRTTYLAAHALPPEFAGRSDDYIDAVCEWLPRLHGEGLVDAVDAFCEGIGFSPAQVRRVFEAARGLGLPVKLPADQLR